MALGILASETDPLVVVLVGTNHEVSHMMLTVSTWQSCHRAVTSPPPSQGPQDRTMSGPQVALLIWVWWKLSLRDLQSSIMQVSQTRAASGCPQQDFYF